MLSTLLSALHVLTYLKVGISVIIILLMNKLRDSLCLNKIKFGVLSKEIILGGFQYSSFYNIQTQQIQYILCIIFYKKWIYSPLKLTGNIK